MWMSDGMARVRVLYRGQPLNVTATDGEAMRSALVRYLEACSTRDVEDRDLLSQMTRNAPSWIDPDGTLRVGAWIFTAEDELSLRYRMPPRAGAIRLYIATLRHTHGYWAVVALESARVSLPRTEPNVH